jgi:hypothetical protein
MDTAFVVPRRLFPVEHRFLELDGFRIHYVDEGAGDVLLLLHGNPSWSFLYRKLIAALSDDSAASRSTSPAMVCRMHRSDSASRRENTVTCSSDSLMCSV